MFPLNLQRNIVQLDKQIALLENECKNMEADKKKKSSKLDPSYSTCSKMSNPRLKPPAVKLPLKKADSCKKNKKATSPISARLQSTCSVPLSCSKAWSEIGDGYLRIKSNSSGFNSNSCCCKIPCAPQSRKVNKCKKCICCKNRNEPDSDGDEECGEIKKDYVMHKELLCPNAGGAIEVTVTRKSKGGKESSPASHKSPIRKSLISERKAEKDFDGCKCHIKGKKWSEILCGDSPRQKEINNVEKTKFSPDETRIIHHPVNFTNSKKSELNSPCDCQNNKINKEESFEYPVRLSPQSGNLKTLSEIISNKIEEVQPCGENCSGEPAKEIKDPVKLFKFLVNQIQRVSSENMKKLQMDTETTPVSPPEKDKNIFSNNDDQNNVAFLAKVKRHYENLVRENELLSQQLVVRDNTIAAMNKREDEYLSLIGSLKSSLAKAKESAQEGADAVKELNLTKTKLLQYLKKTEALEKSHRRLQKFMEQCALENDKLKTEIKIFQLEAQKNEILLAGKEAEISKYKEEIINFQRQISDHLASLKSNAQEINIEKMVEAIVQQSQLFAQSGLDSVIERDRKDSSKLQNALIHSSPTSTKTSVVNSSWKQISSIHENDLSKADSEAVIYLNDEANQKDFFQIFGEKPVSESKSPKKSKEPSDEKLLDVNNIKRSSSFTSLSTHNEPDDDGKNKRRGSLESKGSSDSDDEKSDEESKKTSVLSLDKVDANIDELLKNMKLKFSKEIFDNSLPSFTTEDFPDISQISSISPLE